MEADGEHYQPIEGNTTLDRLKYNIEMVESSIRQLKQRKEQAEADGDHSLDDFVNLRLQNLENALKIYKEHMLNKYQISFYLFFFGPISFFNPSRSFLVYTLPRINHTFHICSCNTVSIKDDTR